MCPDQPTTPEATGGSPNTGSPRARGEGALRPAQHWIDLDDGADADSALGYDAESSTASISSSILQYRTLNGRTYHSDRGVNRYWGPNDGLANNTLDIQHHTLTLSIGGKLNLAPLPAHIDKAVDIGTGTGIWAIDFADERPDTEVIGTDLSPRQPTWVPPNVRFMIDDFTESWTFDEDSIDYVHARWLIGSVVDWDQLFAEAFKAIKPGGWIESHESNGYFISDDDSVTDTSAIAQYGVIFREGALKIAAGTPCASFAIVRDDLTKKAIEKAGFINIEEKFVKVPVSEWPKDPEQHEIGQFARAAMEADLEGLVGYMAHQLGWTKNQIAVYCMHLRRELRNPKIHAYYETKVVWGQKPLKEEAKGE